MYPVKRVLESEMYPVKSVLESELYPVKRKWQSESRPPPVVEVAPPSPVKQTALQPVPGLTIYMHPPHVLEMNQYGPLMVLFESFYRSNVNFSFDSTKCSEEGSSCQPDEEVMRKYDWKTNLFIEGKLVSSGIQNRELKSKKEAAEKALAILRESQPVHINSAQETFYTRNEIIPNLVLHFKDSRQAGKKRKAEWYDVLIDSCQKCGLEVSWWENFGAMFQTKWLVVLLINSKPMSVSWADTLEDAKRAAGITAVSLLKFNHTSKSPVSLKSVYLKYPGEEKVTDAYRILQRSARIGAGETFHMRDKTETDEGTGNTTFFSDLYLYDNLIASGKGLSKKEARKNAANQGLQNLMRTLPVVIHDSKGPEKLLRVTQHPNASISYEAIPGLICYLKPSEQRHLIGDDNTTLARVLQRAASRFNCSVDVRQEGTVFSEILKRHIFKTNLYIGEHLFSAGVGIKVKEAKHDAFKKGYNRLCYNHPIVYIDSDGNDTEPCSQTSNKELDGNVVSEVHNNDHSQGVNKRKYGGETSEEKGSFVTRSEWMDIDGGLLLSDNIDGVDTNALIKKYIDKYVDI